MSTPETFKAKFCPLSRDALGRLHLCVREDCQLWIKVSKKNDIGSAILDYEGCGLIATIPWRVKTQG